MNEKEYIAALEQLHTVEKAYLAIFGEHSLDRVSYYEPLNPTIDDFKIGIQNLSKAIAENKPIYQPTEEEFNMMIF